MILRTKTKKVKVGNVLIGGQNKIVLQSMTNTKTSNIKKTLDQIKKLNSLGAEIIRLSILDNSDLKALKKITKLSPCPIIADIHFNYEFALKAIESGVAKIRINPGNISDEQQLKQIVDKAKEYNIAIRIGINTGSLPKNIKSILEIIEYTNKIILQFEKWNFKKIIVSLKSSDPIFAQKLYLAAAKKIQYPLHLGVTEAGGLLDAAIKSSVGLGPIIQSGIGDTMRISISGDPCKEMMVAKQILDASGLSQNIPNIIACPTCGRTQINLEKILNSANKYLQNFNQKIKVCIMGCSVNGIGESLQADIGLVGSNKKVIFYYRGQVDKVVDEKDALNYFKKLVNRLISKS